MYKKFLWLICAMGCLFLYTPIYAQTVPDLPVTELPFETPSTDKNPIREWIDAVMDNLQWEFLVEADSTFETSFQRVLAQVNVIINYLLWLLGIIALIYMIYHGFKMLFAINDDNAFSKGREWVKTAAVALIWIWLSRVIVRFIFYILNLIG